VNVLRIPEAEPDVEHPFRDDLLDRKDLAERLTRFLANVQGPFTMALTGPYGSGKTFFLRRCKVLLEKLYVPTVLINAWETDFSAEPLAPILSELEEKFSAKLKSSEQDWKKTRELAAKFVALSVPMALRVVADVLPGGRAIGDSLEKAVQKQFEQFTAAKKSIESLKKTLGTLTEHIRESAKPPIETSENVRPPIVVLVDELDRCRPNYAIHLLEVLKFLPNAWNNLCPGPRPRATDFFGEGRVRCRVKR
jgi:KAP family P-loop domain